MVARLRSLELTDLPVVRVWRNHPEVNRYMFNQHKVTEKEHLAWFVSAQKNELRSLFVYEDGCEIKGFVQLEKKSEISNVLEWGFYVNPEAARGLGTKMASLALNKVFLEMNGSKLFGEVLSFNESSISFHQKLGFHQEGMLRGHHRLNGKNYDVFCFGLLKSEWLKKIKQINSDER